MSPKEKAEELVNKFNYEDKHYLMLDAKQCALIAVDELIEETYFTDGYYQRHKYWEEVKEEIENI